jgi:AcrR family transcriptional regulator
MAFGQLGHRGGPTNPSSASQYGDQDTAAWNTITVAIQMDVNLDEDAPVEEKTARQRILEAAFKAFSDKGYESASTLAIATEARVSKRDLYANFGTKHEILVACMEGRTAKMNLFAKLPRPTSLPMLESVLVTFSARVLTEVSNPTVVSVFRLAIAEATRSPDIAQFLDKVGRKATQRTLAQWMSEAQAAGFLADGDPRQFATEFLALVWEGLWISLVLGVASTPTKKAIEGQAKRAAGSFITLHGKRSARS